jgi:DNA mismatch repair protein MutL
VKSIFKLSPQLIAQIAAGEVIERPSYAVKELIDNAIDANATEINLSLEDGGLKKIIISDNGIGMSKDDLFESYKIHTTSKVKNVDSLNAIQSMGFRGEALASIAAVAKLEIKSRTGKDIAGYAIEVINGKLINDRPIGMPEGTTIEISNIFSSVPARKKFLKSTSTELRNIIDMFIAFAIAFPKIKFTLSHNNKILFNLNKTESLLTRASFLLNESIINNLIPVLNNDSYIKINGFIAKPQYTTQSTSKQFLFVNNRRIQDKTISQAIKDSYSSLIPDRQLPVFLLFISIPFELVDVNVHPRKEQLAFHSTQTIYNAVYKSIKDTLDNNNLTFGKNNAYSPITKSTTGNILNENTNPWHVKNEQVKINFKTIQQIHNLYITIETKQGLLMIDQHAAHERILFEQFKNEFLSQKSKNHKLVKPIKLKLTTQEILLIEENKIELSKIGLIFNESLTEMIEIPKIFDDRNINEILKELLENLEHKNYVKEIDSVSLKIIQFLACKNAIKAGDKLEKEEAIKLIKKLEQTENNYTCPHGRPTKYIFALKELNKLFKRF